MADRIGKIEAWVQPKTMRGGTSAFRNKLKRAKWFLEQSATHVVSAANREYGTRDHLLIGAEMAEQIVTQLQQGHTQS